MKQNKPDSRCATCPRWDRWHIRIPNPEDQQKLIELYRRSGAKTKSDYIRGRLLNSPFKVIAEDPSAELHSKELDSIISKLRIIGVRYNEATKRLNSYHSGATAQRMIRKLKVYSEVIFTLQIQAIQLTDKFQEKDKR